MSSSHCCLAGWEWSSVCCPQCFCYAGNTNEHWKIILLVCINV